MAVIEVLLLVGLSIPFWSWKVSAFPTDPATVHVRVIAQQFAWNIHYPGRTAFSAGRTSNWSMNRRTQLAWIARVIHMPRMILSP